jgi:hypothetical protein
VLNKKLKFHQMKAFNKIIFMGLLLITVSAGAQAQTRKTGNVRSPGDRSMAEMQREFEALNRSRPKKMPAAVHRAEQQERLRFTREQQRANLNNDPKPGTPLKEAPKQ